MLKELIIEQLKKAADLNKDGELNLQDLLLASQLIISYLLAKQQEKK